MGSSANDTMRAKLIALIQRGAADQRDFIATLSEAERMATGTPAAWAVKDHLAHLNFWRRQSVIRLAAAKDGTEPPNVDDFEALNARAFAEQQQTPWADLVADSERLFTEATDLLAGFTDDELTDPQRYPWRNGQPLATSLTGNYFEHPAEHYTQLYRERGDTARAEAQQQAVVKTIAELFGQSAAYANALYNLGCYYARNAEPERAISALRQALPLNPSLVEWSRQDTDLDSLRTLPAFQALYPAE